VHTCIKFKRKTDMKKRFTRHFALITVFVGTTFTTLNSSFFMKVNNKI